MIKIQKNGLKKFSTYGQKTHFIHVSEQHLDRYVGEFVYRYNNREMLDSERAKKAVKQTEGKRLVYKDAIKKTSDSLVFFCSYAITSMCAIFSGLIKK